MSGSPSVMRALRSQGESTASPDGELFCIQMVRSHHPAYSLTFRGLACSPPVPSVGCQIPVRCQSGSSGFCGV
jgi:hypothetical protein